MCLNLNTELKKPREQTKKKLKSLEKQEIDIKIPDLIIGHKTKLVLMSIINSIV